jgi:type I restriction enzyme S subunit
MKVDSEARTLAEVGSLADEWRVANIRDVATQITVGFVGSMSHLFRSAGILVLRGSNVKEGKLELSDLRFIDAPTHTLWKKSALLTGDILVVRVGYPGTACVVPDGIGQANAAGLVLIRPDRAIVVPEYLVACLNSGDGRRQVQSLLVGGAQQVFNTATAAEFSFLLPPLKEQEAIAEALSDADAAIEALDALIAKKRDVKQAAMQQLLTGRTRLPGFIDEWRECRIGDFTACKAGGTPSTGVSAYWGGSIRWMSSGELNEKRVSEVSGRITDLGLANSSAQIFPPFSVLIGLAGQGKTRGTAAINLVALATNQSIAAIFPSNEHDSRFLYYVMDTKYEELRGLSDGGGGRGGLNLSIIRSVQARLPTHGEQAKIADILWDMDSEIDALVSERDKMRLVKQGMMQELLSGRVRLP